MIGNAISPMFTRQRNGYGAYTTAFNAVVVSRGGSLTANELSYLTTFENSVGSDLAEFDRLWIHGLSNQIAAKTSFVNPSSTAITEVNSPTWTANQGYQGNGTTSYLNLNYTPSVDTVKYILNSAALYDYCRTNSVDSGFTIGCASGGVTQAYLNSGYSGVGIISTVNQLLASAFANADSRGFYASKRTSNSVNKIIKNGVAVYTDNQVSAILPTVSIYGCAANNNGSVTGFTSKQSSLKAISSGNINDLNFYNAVQALGTSIGWAL